MMLYRIILLRSNIWFLQLGMILNNLIFYIRKWYSSIQSSIYFFTLPFPEFLLYYSIQYCLKFHYYIENTLSYLRDDIQSQGKWDFTDSLKSFIRSDWDCKAGKNNPLSQNCLQFSSFSLPSLGPTSTSKQH